MDNSTSIQAEQANAKKYRPVTKACTTCRQSKVKCNVAETFPAPCSRCSRLKKECRSDPTFKRTRVRGRLEEVTKQLDRIQRARSQQQEELSRRSTSEAPCSDLSLPLQTPAKNEHPESSHVPFGLHQVDERCSQVSMQELHGIQLSNFDVVELFKYFSKQYLPLYPILDTRMSINNLHQKNSLLFWTIIVIACRDHPTLKHNFERLSKPFNTLLSETLAGPMRSVYTIHSLLLFCLWPLPVSKQILDPSWNYIGIAVSAALRMGLHSNHAPWEYGLQKFSVEDIQLRRRTWLTCFMVSTYLSSDLGLPSPMSLGSDFNIMLQEWLSSNTTKTLALHLEIQYHVARFSSILNEPNGSLIRSPLILMFDHELEALGTQVAKADGHLTQITCLGARLKLYSFSLLFECRNTDIPGQNYIDPSRKTIWYLGLETAVRLAYVCTSACEKEGPVNPQPPNPSQSQSPSSHPPLNPYIFYPKHTFFLLINAGLYLLKFLLVLNDTLTSTEKDLARDHVRMVHSCLLKWSRQENDECVRFARVVALLANAEVQGKLREICKDTRPGATLLADGMRMAIWLRAQDKDAAAQSVLNASPIAHRAVSSHNNNDTNACIHNASASSGTRFDTEGGAGGDLMAGERNAMENSNLPAAMGQQQQRLTFEQETELAQTTMMDCLMPDDDLMWKGLDFWLTDDLPFGSSLDDSFDRMPLLKRVL